MTEHAWIEIASLAVGGICAVMVLLIGRSRGIGPQIRLTLAVCLIAPLLVILGLEKVLSSETVAAIVGAFVGAGVPASSLGGPGTGQSK
jgi:hypothetical protein